MKFFVVVILDIFSRLTQKKIVTFGVLTSTRHWSLFDHGMQAKKLSLLYFELTIFTHFFGIFILFFFI